MSGKISKGVGKIIYWSANEIELAIYDNSYCGTYNVASDEVEVKDYDGDCHVSTDIVEEPLEYTPDECFTFDKTTGTITKYDKSKEVCGVEVVIPESIDGVKVIGSNAFVMNRERNSDSKKITKVVFPSGLESIEFYAFLGNEDVCYNDGDYSFDEVCYDYYYNAITGLDFRRVKNLNSIGFYAFSNNQLTNVDMPKGLIVLSNGVFENNYLTSVIIPSGVTSIGAYAFDLNQLTSVLIKGKSSSSDFESYPSYSPFDWASGYNDSNITWNG